MIPSYEIQEMIKLMYGEILKSEQWLAWGWQD